MLRLLLIAALVATVLSDSIPPTFSYSSSSYKIIRGKPFSAVPTVEGDSVQFTLKEGKLPSGLTLSSTTGVISGTPTEGSRTANVTVEGSNTVGSYHVSLLFIPISPPSIKYPEDSYILKEGVNTEIKPEVKYVQNIYLRSGSIPEGMELSAIDGTISGIPSEIGTTKALIAAENQDGTMTATVIIEVSENIPIPERIWTIMEYILIVIGILVVVCCCCCYCAVKSYTVCMNITEMEQHS